MIGPSGTVRVMVATKPVDFRKGAEGLAALVRETMGADPFTGTVYVFRARRAQRQTFSIRFSVCPDRLSLAPAVRPGLAGVLAPAWQGSHLHLHH